MADGVRREDRVDKVGRRALQAGFFVVWWVAWWTILTSRAYSTTLIWTGVGLEVCIAALYGVAVRTSTEKLRGIVVGSARNALSDARKAVSKIEGSLSGKGVDIDAALDGFADMRQTAKGVLSLAGGMRFTRRLFSIAVWLLVSLLLLLVESTVADGCPVSVWCGVPGLLRVIGFSLLLHSLYRALSATFTFGRVVLGRSW